MSQSQHSDASKYSVVQQIISLSVGNLIKVIVVVIEQLEDI